MINLCNSIKKCPTISLINTYILDKKRVNTYSMKHQWSLILLENPLYLIVNNKPYRTKIRTITILPPGTSRVFHFPKDYVMRPVHFSLNSEDASLKQKPIFIQDHPNFPHILRQHERALSFWPKNKERVESIIWNSLWEINDILTVKEKDLPPILENAISLMDNTKSRNPNIKSIASELNISHNYLVLLFKKHLNTTPLKYIQKKCYEMANYYLTETDIPIKEIAYTLEFTDLANFNKFIKKHSSQNPKSLRG